MPDAIQHVAEIALAYLTGDTAEEMLLPGNYNRDLISRRETGMPINCIHVSPKGDPDTHELMAYVEIYGHLDAGASFAYPSSMKENILSTNTRSTTTDGHELDLFEALSCRGRTRV